MKNLTLLILIIYVLSSCSGRAIEPKQDFIIGNGQMPQLITDKKNNLHLVFGSGDSILYVYSTDHGHTFSSPSLVAVLPELAAAYTRGPQIAATTKGLIIVACNSRGDIFSFNQTGSGNWQQTGKVNDVDTTAKENLIALGGDEANAFAVWLDLRVNKRNKIYGAKLADGGKSWSKNVLVYASPDSTVCQCCKPSVVVNGKNVYVMFRNWLNGNRDLYLIQSKDAGNTFGEAEKLGKGSCKLDACPMDGGALAVDKVGSVQTVWRREGRVYAAAPGKPEQEIGDGRGCTLGIVDGKPVYAWTEKGEVVVIDPKGQRKVVGKGTQPVIQALDNKSIICVWENDKKIHASVLQL